MSRRTLATLYGVGLVRFAPGTAGSAVAAMLAYGILLLPNGAIWLAAGTLLFVFLGTRSATHYMQTYASAHDPKEIVVDELAGQWLTYALMPLYYEGVLRPLSGNDFLPGTDFASAGDDFLALFTATELAGYILLGFLLFRFFDIVKPWPIRWADRKVKGGFGVMFDDLLAAIPAAILLPTMYFMFRSFLSA